MKNMTHEFVKDFFASVRNKFTKQTKIWHESTFCHFDENLCNEKKMNDIEESVVFFEGGVDEIIQYFYYVDDEEGLAKADLLKEKQQESYDEVKNLKFEDNKEGNTLLNLEKYYDALFVLDLFLTNDVNLPALKKASEIRAFLIGNDEDHSKMYFGQKKGDIYFIEAFAIEFIRKCLLDDYTFVQEEYERLFNFDLLKPDKDAAKWIMKYCYIIARINLGSEDEGMRYASSGFLENVIMSWYVSLLKNYYWGFPFYWLPLIALLQERTFETYSGNPFDLLEKIHPDYVEKEIDKQYQKKKQQR